MMNASVHWTTGTSKFSKYDWMNAKIHFFLEIFKRSKIVLLMIFSQDQKTSEVDFGRKSMTLTLFASQIPK